MRIEIIVKASSVISAVLMVGILLNVTAFAATICVDPFNVSCYSTIQEGVDAAGSGDTVEVASGTYVEQVTLKDDVTIQGANRETTSVWNNNDTFVGINVSNVTIEEFTITSADGDAIYFSATGYNKTFLITIKNNIIKDSNTGIRFAVPFIYGGTGSVSGNIWNNVIANNAIGIILRYNDADLSGCDPKIVNNVIYGNQGDGILMYDEYANANSTPYISNNIIMLNGNWGITNTEMAPSVAFNDAYNNTTGDYNGVTVGPGSISDDPEFVDEANEDFHLMPTSPAIDAGNPVNAPLDDIDGDSRPQGASWDMGVDEYSGGACSFSLDLKVNGSDNKVIVTPAQSVSVTLSLCAGQFEDLPVEWWVGAQTTSFGNYWFNSAGQWTQTMMPYKQGPLADLPETEVLNLTLPVGVYHFFTLIEASTDGKFNPVNSQSVEDNVSVYSKQNP